MLLGVRTDISYLVRAVASLGFVSLGAGLQHVTPMMNLMKKVGQLPGQWARWCTVALLHWFYGYNI